MTALVFLKKSYQLSQTRESLWYISSEDLGEGEAIRSRSTSFSSPKLNQRQMTLALLKAPPPPPLPPMPDVSEVPSPPLVFKGKMVKPRPASPVNLLEDRDEDVVAALAKFSILQPEGRPAAPATAPPTPKQSPERKPTPDQKPKRKSKNEDESDSPARAVVPGTVPEWEGKFWSKYGNRSRVGQFGHILYIGKMAGEQMPGEENTEKLGTQMLEELEGETPEEDEEEGPEEEDPEREVEWSIPS